MSEEAWRWLVGLAIVAAVCWWMLMPVKPHSKRARRVPEHSLYYARRGEIVTCENGHPIVTMMRDVKLGEQFDPDAFVNWRQVPDWSVKAPVCDRCGTPFWMPDNVFHFDDGWRHGPRRE